MSPMERTLAQGAERQAVIAYATGHHPAYGNPLVVPNVHLIEVHDVDDAHEACRRA